MDSAEKIILFKSFEDLTREIIRDRDSGDMLAQRYAVPRASPIARQGKFCRG